MLALTLHDSKSGCWCFALWGRLELLIDIKHGGRHLRYSCPLWYIPHDVKAPIEIGLSDKKCNIPLTLSRRSTGQSQPLTSYVFLISHSVFLVVLFLLFTFFNHVFPSVLIPFDFSGYTFTSKFLLSLSFLLLLLFRFPSHLLYHLNSILFDFLKKIVWIKMLFHFISSIVYSTCCNTLKLRIGLGWQICICICHWQNCKDSLNISRVANLSRWHSFSLLECGFRFV